jgi:hypothetical protein
MALADLSARRATVGTVMPTTIVTENPGKDVRRYLRHCANPRFVEDSLSARHTGLSKEQRRRKSRAAALSILQGVEFLEAADIASPLTRPLPLFYATENIVKGMALISDASLEASDFRSHGLSGDKAKRNSIKNFRCKVQNPGRDVWSRAYRLLNADWITMPVVEDAQPLTTAWRSASTAPSLAGREIALGDLVRQLPEMTRDVVVTNWGHPYAVHASTFAYRTTSEPPSHSLRVRLRHAHNTETRAMLVRQHERGEFKGWALGTDSLDVIEFSKSVEGSAFMAPSLRCDTFGDLYMHFGPPRLQLGELLIHHAALFILSDVVRYQVDQWARLLDDHPEEAILVERLLDVAARKVPNLALNELEGDHFQFAVSRG